MPRVIPTEAATESIPALRRRWPASLALAFVVLAVLTVGGWSPLDAFDTAVSGWFRRLGNDHLGLIAVLRVVTDVAATGSYLLVGGVAAGALAVRRRRPAALLTTAITVAVPVLWALMHWLLPHARPGDAFVVVTSNGFPSGHTSNATAMAVTAVLLCWCRLHGTGRILLLLTAVGFAVVVGVTRLALLAHWPADVLGGWLLGAAVVLALVRVRAWGLPARAEPTPPAG